MKAICRGDQRTRGRIPGNKTAIRQVLGVMATGRFEQTVLPHLDAAFNYARWLTRSEAEAEDVVQDACVRALRFFPKLRGDDARAWLLTIVRNACFARAPRGGAVVTAFPPDGAAGIDDALGPEGLAIQR